jgi:hypothetical protein
MSQGRFGHGTVRQMGRFVHGTLCPWNVSSWDASSRDASFGDASSGYRLHVGYVDQYKKAKSDKK